MASIKGILKGATFGTLLGSLAVFLYPKRREIMQAVLEHASDFSEKAKDYAEDFLGNEGRMIFQRASRRNGYVTSGLAGAFIGAGIALALAPKSGRQFRNQLSKVYQTIFDRTQEVAHSFRNNTHPTRNGIAHRSAHRKQKRLSKHK